MFPPSKNPDFLRKNSAFCEENSPKDQNPSEDLENSLESIVFSPKLFELPTKIYKVKKLHFSGFLR